MHFYLRRKYTTGEEYLVNKSEELPLPHILLENDKKEMCMHLSYDIKFL